MTTLGPDFRHADRILKAKRGPVDGDGDGFVYDGTPKKRPATPAEMAAGRAMRAGKKAVGAAAAPKAGKKAAPKNDYDKRVDKFDRAINQAIRSGDKKQVKNVEGYIKGDLVLKPKDRQDLVNVLAARRDGKPDPAPLPGSNRAARMSGGAAPAAKKAAAPAKKAAAKVPAKKVAAKKPEKDATERNGVPVGRKTAASLDRLDAADKAKAQRKPVKAAAGKKAAKKPGPVTRAHQQMRDAGLDIPEKSKPESPSAVQRFRDRLRGRNTSAANRRMARARALTHLKNNFEGKELDNETDLNRLADAIIAARDAGADDNDLAPWRKMLGEGMDRVDAAKKARDASFQRRAAKKSPKGIPARKQVAPKSNVTTLHGPKTQAWKRLVQRDIQKATRFRDLKAAITQISNLRSDGRISQKEADALRQQVYDRLESLGLDRNGNRKPVVGWNIRRTPKTPAKGAQTKAYEALGQATSDTQVQRAAMSAHEAWKRGEIDRGVLDEIEREALRVKRRLADNKAANASFQRKAMENAQIKVERAIDEAGGMTELAQVQRQMQAPQNKNLRDFLRDNPDKMQRLNEKFKAKKDAIRNGTVQPKMPPGQARARAKENLPSDWADRIAGAKDISDVESLMSDLEKVPADQIDADAFNEIAEALNKRMDELDAQAANFDHTPYVAVMGKNPKVKDVLGLVGAAYDPAQINGLLRAYEASGVNQKDIDAVRKAVDERHRTLDAQIRKAEHAKLKNYGVPSRSPAAVDNSAEAMLALHSHFSGGGDIASAPVVGLWNYLQASDRFTVTPKSGVSGITPKFTVDDSVTGERWWVKADWTNMVVVEHGALKEQWGGALMEAMGIDAPKVKMGQFGGVDDNIETGHGKFMLVQDAGAAYYRKPGLKVKDGFYGPQDMANVRGGVGAADYARLHLLDYVMDNNDRHGGNVMGIEGPGGPRVPLLDFGLGMGYWKHKVDPDLSPLAYLQNKSRRDSVGDAILRDPDSNRHMADIQAELRRVRVDLIVAAMIQNGQDPEQARLWGRSMQNRIDKLLGYTPDQLTQLFSRN